MGDGRAAGREGAPRHAPFADFNKALADTPPDRFAGVIMSPTARCTTCRSPRPRSASTRRCIRCSPASPDEFDRRIEVLKAPRYGIVGQSREIEIAVRETGKKGRRTTASR